MNSPLTPSPPRATRRNSVPGVTPEEHLELLVEQERAAGTRSPAHGHWRAWPRKLLPAWLRRRGWLLAISVLVGSFAGLMVGATTPTSYTAVATLVVPTGASGGQSQTVTGSTVTGPPTPGDAYGAQQLAIADAAVIRSDNGLLTSAAARLNVPLDTLTERLSVSVETGTPVVLIGYTAPTKADAVRGVNAIGSAIVKSERTNNSLIPTGTLNVVQLATSASGRGLFAKYGFEIGLVLGLLIGCILVLVAERVDPRADTSTDVSQVFRGSVASLPSELSLLEFGHAVLSSSAARSGVTLAPLRWWDVPAAHHIEETLGHEFPDRRVDVSTGLEEGMAHRLRDDSAVVLIVRSGEQLRAVGDALERLRLVGTAPQWIALLDRDDFYD